VVRIRLERALSPAAASKGVEASDRAKPPHPRADELECPSASAAAAEALCKPSAGLKYAAERAGLRRGRRDGPPAPAEPSLGMFVVGEARRG
jgi:hypothetical protein